MRLKFGLAAAVAATIAVAGCSSSSDSSTPNESSGNPTTEPTQAPLTSMKVSLSGVQGQYCVIPYGEKLGLYSKHGVELDSTTLQATQTVGALLASGQLDLGITNAFSVMKLDSNGSTIKAIMGQYQNQAASIIVPESSDIKTVADLKGKTIASSASTSGQLLPGVLEKNGVKPSDVKRVTVQTSALVQSLSSKRADAITGNVYAEAVAAEQALKAPVRTLKYNDLGFGGETVVYATGEKFLKEHSDALKGFIAGTQESLEAAKKDPTACVEALKDAQGAATLPDDATLVKQLQAALPFVSTPESAGHPVGWMAPADWEQSATAAKQLLGLDSGFDATSAYTNELFD
jgi:NitT/TauT family transport system substrate-binding protein